MSQLTVGLLGGAWGHETGDATLAYFDSTAAQLEREGHIVLPLPYTGRNMQEYAQSVCDACAGCDVIICFSTGALVARMATKLKPQLAEKVWIGVSPVPATGLSLRAFLWAVSCIPIAFTLALVHARNGVYVNAVGLRRLFGSSMDPHRAYALATRLHPEPIWPCLQLSFPKLFGLASDIAQIHWTKLFVPMRDGFVTCEDVQDEPRSSLDHSPQSGHGWITTYKAANALARIVQSVSLSA